MTKACSVCREEKALTDFFVRDQKLNRVHSQCKACYKRKRLLFMKEHYEKYGDAYRTRARIRKAALKKHRQEMLYEYLKDKQCESCGVNDIRVLDFDHIDPSTKSFGIARGVGDGIEWNKILLEIKKCRILCANCHRIVTAEQQKWRKAGALAEKSGTALQKLKDGGSTRTHLQEL